MMSRIAEQVERDALYWTILDGAALRAGARPRADAIAAAAHQMVDALDLTAIMAWTHLGLDGPAARPLAAQRRPSSP